MRLPTKAVMFASGLMLMVSVSGIAAEGRKREPSSAFGRSGCGLASLIITEKDKNSQILASVINTYIGFVSSAITSGTSNCNYDNDTAQIEQKVYIFSNLSSLESDAAAGRGAHLAALGQLFGCEDEADVQEFFEFNKSRYEEIYQEREPEMVFSAMKKAGKADGRISDHCPGFG
jgi:hypothetical protein